MISFGVTIPVIELVRLVPIRVTMEPGEAPGGKLAPLTIAVMVGPGGGTAVAVSANSAVKPPDEAVTTMLPGVEPAVTVIDACPLLPVGTVAALSVALPLVTAKATLTPATGLLLAFTAWTTNGIEKAVLTVAVCPPPETALSAVSGTLTVRLKVAETVPAVTVTVTGPAVLPRVARADARPL